MAVIQAIKIIWKIPWTINTTILDAGEDLKMFDEVQIQHVFRKANGVADWLAHMGNLTANFTYWFEVSDFSFGIII